MKVKELINKLQKLKSGMEEKEVVIIAPNGLKFSPEIKFELKGTNNPLNHSVENVNRIVLTH